MSNIYLLLNILLWLLTLFIYQNKKRVIDTGSILLISFLIYSISSYILFNSSYDYQYFDLSLLPFIYLYIMIMLVLSPILMLNINSNTTIQRPSNLLLYSIILIYSISSLINLSTTINNIYDGINTIINDPLGAVELYREKMDNSFNVGDSKISNIFSVFSNLLSDIGILIFFYYLSLERKNKLIVYALALSMIASIFEPLSMSQRGPAVDRLLTIIIAYFAFRGYLSSSINRKVRKFGILLLILFAVPVSAITLSRFGEREGGADGSVFLYIGQQNLNFNKYAFDNNGIRNGDRIIPLFKRALGFKNVPINFWERRVKYPDLKINDEVFIGFVGDFILDFGPITATIILILFTLFALYKTKIKNNKLLFHQLVLIYFIMCVCIRGGLKLFTFSDTGGNLGLIVFIIVYIIFKLDYKIKLNPLNK